MTPAEHDERLALAAGNGDTEGILQAIREGAYPKRDRGIALSKAAENGHVECVRMLIPLSYPRDLDSVSFPKSDNFSALRIAAGRGDVDCIKALLPEKSTNLDLTHALDFAAMNGHVECVRFLLAFTDAKSNNSGPLQGAARRGHRECVEELIPVSDIDQAIRSLKDSDHHEAALFIEAVRQAKSLSDKNMKHGRHPDRRCA